MYNMLSSVLFFSCFCKAFSVSSIDCTLQIFEGPLKADASYKGISYLLSEGSCFTKETKLSMYVAVNVSSLYIRSYDEN